MTSAAIVRASTEADMAAIKAIYAHHVLTGLATFEEIPPDVNEMLARRQAIIGAGLPYLVAEAGGTILGYAYAGPFRPRAAYRFTLEDSIYLDPAATGRGIGRALLSELVRLCELGPWKQMVAVIGDSANAGSIAVHRACGFHHVGSLANTGFKFNRWVDTVLMQRALGPQG